MGERSNIFVRIRAKHRTSDKKYKKEAFFGLYYQWCYGERMISRLRSAIDFVDTDISGWHNEHVVNDELIDKFKRYLAINFDMRDVIDTVDLIKDVSNDVKSGYANTNANIFNQCENHGFIYIDISLDDPSQRFGENKAKIKYAFVDNEVKAKDGTVPPVRSVENFADHDIGEDERKWYEPNPYWDENERLNGLKERFLNEIVPTCKKNMAEIDASATVMTEDERKDFVKFGRAYTKKILKKVKTKQQETQEKRRELIACLNKVSGNPDVESKDIYNKLLVAINIAYPEK